jgi:integrase
MIPRWGGHVPLYIGDLIASCALSLNIHLVRETSEGLFPSKGYVLPGRNNPKSVPTKKERTEANTTFAVWLQALVKEVGIREKITFSRLAQLSRGRLTCIYSQPVAGAILGLHRYNPAPPYQSNLFGDYRLPLDLDRSLPIPQQKDVLEEKPKIRLPILRDKYALDYSTGTAKSRLPLPFGKVREITAQFSRRTKRKASRRRGAVLKQLRSLISKWEMELGKSWALDWNAYIAQVIEDEHSRWQIDGINGVLIAHWMVHLIGHSPPNTVEARLNDLATFLRIMVSKLMSTMTEEQITNVIHDVEISARSRERLASSIRAFFGFLKVDLEISLPEISLWHIGWTNSVSETPLLLQAYLGQILSNTDPNRPEIVIAIILAYFFGIRASEVCDLKIGHLQFGTRPTIYVLKSKGGSSRHVEGIEIPKEVIKHLQNFHSERLDAANGEMSQPLLTNSEGRPLSRQLLSRIWKNAVNLKIIEPLERKEILSFHSIRHACANRWLALQVPLVDIARMLGHRSLETTVRSYIHSFHFIQKEQLDRYLSETKPFLVSTRGLADLLDLTPRRVRQICRSANIHFQRIRGKTFYSSKDVLSILDSYFSKVLTVNYPTNYIRK